MKTKNNVQKAVLRSAAVIASFVLISLTVSAQDFWKKLLTNSSFNEIALAMTESSETKSNSEMTTSFPYFLNKESDEDLQLEDWMLNESNFEYSSYQYQEEQENSLDVEDWMLNEKWFENLNENEPELNVESWMTSDKVWNI